MNTMNAMVKETIEEKMMPLAEEGALAILDAVFRRGDDGPVCGGIATLIDDDGERMCYVPGSISRALMANGNDIGDDIYVNVVENPMADKRDRFPFMVVRFSTEAPPLRRG